MGSVDVRRIGFGLAVATTVAMATHAGVAALNDAPRADDLWAYTVFVGIGVAGFTVAAWRGAAQAGWGLLVPAFMTLVAANEGLPVLRVYTALFVLTVVLTQLVPIWRGSHAPGLQMRSPADADTARPRTEHR